MRDRSRAFFADLGSLTKQERGAPEGWCVPEAELTPGSLSQRVKEGWGCNHQKRRGSDKGECRVDALTLNRSSLVSGLAPIMALNSYIYIYIGDVWWQGFGVTLSRTTNPKRRRFSSQTFETTSTLLSTLMENQLATLNTEIATVAADIKNEKAELKELYVASGGESTDRIVSLEKSLDALRAEKITLLAERKEVRQNIANQLNQGTSTLSAPHDKLEGTSGGDTKPGVSPLPCSLS